eukprot:s1177_g10.t1
MTESRNASAKEDFCHESLQPLLLFCNIHKKQLEVPICETRIAELQGVVSGPQSAVKLRRQRHTLEEWEELDDQFRFEIGAESGASATAAPAAETAKDAVPPQAQTGVTWPLTEWAQREKLGYRFVAGIEDLRFGQHHRQISAGTCYCGPSHEGENFVAIKRKLEANKKLRFGEVEKFDPILKKKPSTKCPWTEIDVTHDTMTLRAAVRTWRFCTTGLDGLEEETVMRNAFEAMKPEKAGIWVLCSAPYIYFEFSNIFFRISRCCLPCGRRMRLMPSHTQGCESFHAESGFQLLKDAQLYSSEQI